MKEASLRKFHRILAVSISLFILLQVVTGMLISIGFLTGTEFFGDVVEILHFGDGVAGNGYRIALALGIITLVASGWWIFIKIATRPGATVRKTTFPREARKPVEREPVHPAR